MGSPTGKLCGPFSLVHMNARGTLAALLSVPDSETGACPQLAPSSLGPFYYVDTRTQVGDKDTWRCCGDSDERNPSAAFAADLFLVIIKKP